MKKWFLERFLPMWAKQTVYRDNQRLAGQLKACCQENERLRAYIKGLEKAGRILRRCAPQDDTVFLS